MDYEHSSWKFMNYERFDRHGDLGSFKVGGQTAQPHDITASFIDAPVAKGGGSGYGGKWKSQLERHDTSAPNPKHHSNPHDHMTGRHTPREGIPHFGPPINYWDGEMPEFKSYSRDNAMRSIIYDTNTPEETRFKAIREFEECILRGGEVVFSWNSKQYGVFKSSTQYCMALFSGEEETWYSSPAELLAYIVGGERLRDVIAQVTVWDRTI